MMIFILYLACKSSLKDSSNILNFVDEETKTVFPLQVYVHYNEIPIVGGNVSLYNTTRDKSIYPTPILVMIGISN